jgi:uncharacterized membrane protein
MDQSSLPDSAKRLLLRQTLPIMEEILDDYRQSVGNDGPSLEELHANGFNFDFGKYFNTGWNAMKEDVGQYILFTFVAILILLVSIITIVGPVLIALPLFSGYMTYGRKVLRNEPRDFNDFFGGFKSFGPLVGFTFLMLLGYSVVALPLLLFAGFDAGWFEAIASDPESAADIVLTGMLPVQLAVTLVSIVVQTLLFFAIPLIVIGKLGSISAIGWSFKIAGKNFWWILLYIFVVGFIQQGGMLACYIGLLFTVPLAQCLQLGAYADIVGLGEKNPSTY